MVVGLGRSGVGAARVLAPVASVAACDAKPLAALGDEVVALQKVGVTVHAENQDPRLLAGVDLVVRSPGVPWDSPLITAAREAGVEIIGELELAFRLMTAEKVIAVTGSNGKSTTAALTGEIFRAAGEDVVVAGNIGTALTSRLGDVKPATTVVLEVSSFQLEDIATFRPFVGVLLNLAPDHLDRHRSVEEYYRLKWRLFENQGYGDYAVLNADDAVIAGEAGQLESEVLNFGFRRPRGRGVWYEEGFVMDNLSGRERRVVPGAAIKLVGEHNLANAMAAACAALAAGAPAEAVVAALSSFAGLPHRLEEVAVVAGVRYVNDSKATNVASAITALRALRPPIVWIAGGKAKGEDFAPLAAAARGKVRAIITYGAARGLLAEALRGVAPLIEVETVAEAVAAAAKCARAGDTVVLAPAATSWDHYANFEERGEDFKRAVHTLVGGMTPCGSR